ncbi:MAG TPA: 50S ribosomal protein L24 [Gammaproteobacteria bacterium]|nr:50S ribosomal protein L24 [Gammaproteobacteria bacterium]
MSLAKFKKNDLVLITVGKDRGKVGAIKAVLKEGKVIVEGVNQKKKTVKANREKNEQGGFQTVERPIDRSNITHYNQETKKRVKVGVKKLENGKRVRYDKSTQEVID